ncbi:hypothetical protein [Cytobacillus pseudoceanisediminis]|uniref:hypothetical protein n=1 Tax=Cytobacillus pseudoceanisediminis TaxID=3051614 RepID=UPI003F7106F8
MKLISRSCHTVFVAAYLFFLFLQSIRQSLNGRNHNIKFRFDPVQQKNVTTIGKPSSLINVIICSMAAAPFL